MFQSATLGKIENQDSISILSVEEWINALVRGANNNGTYPISKRSQITESFGLTLDSATMEAFIIVGGYSVGGSGEVPSSSSDSNKLRASILQGCKSIGGNKRDKWWFAIAILNTIIVC